MSDVFVDPDAVGSGSGVDLANAYTALQTAENAEDGDITGTESVVFICASTANTADVFTVIGGWVTDATHTITVRSHVDHRHNGKYGDASGAYKAEATDADIISINNEEFVTIEGLQLRPTFSVVNAKRGIQIVTGTPSLIICIKNIIEVNDANNTYIGINCNDADATLVINNNLIYTTAGGQRGIWANDTAGAKVYNNTVEGFSVAGIDESTANTVVIKNNISFNNGDDIAGGDTVDFNATDDATVGANDIQIADWTEELTNFAAFDYSVKDTGALIFHAGDDQTADGDVPSDDIIYQTRPAGANDVTIGAFELVAVGTTPKGPLTHPLYGPFAGPIAC